MTRATFSNIEHQSIEFVVHTIRPWLVRWEQAITKCLLREGEFDEDLFTALVEEIRVKSLVRGGFCFEGGG